ncbi:hypothetical protein [Hoylesella timonensis]|uniref:hypothetical protein n=1 Tax=Hoylesella timonensis TaxID=386414 RepID=UPI001E3E22F7|nr:hypothetical protein [Hoylesella timonensis]
MTTSKIKRILMAWMMVLTFILALFVKDFHAHTSPVPHFDKIEQHHASVQSYCYICNFDLCKMSMPKLFVWQPVLLVKHVLQPLLAEQIVYRQPVEINAHSPPFLIHNS